MSEGERVVRPCWCGNAELAPFSPEYLTCRRCGSLVSLCGLTPDQVQVRDDGADYYGKSYWLEHQTDELKLPSIEERAFSDLAGRCVYWLRNLLRYCLPPGRVLELACAHGGLVALMRSAGFDATGLEVSPWVVDFARETFQIPTICGPLEEQRLEAGSF